MRGHGKRDRHGDGVTDDVPDDRQQAAEERHHDDHARVRQTDREDKDGGEHGVDAGNDQLRAHDKLETAVK